MHNLPKLRDIGFAANRRVLEVEKLSRNCQIGAKVFDQLQSPLKVQEQRASALRFGDRRVQALLAMLAVFCLQVEGFRNKQLRPLLAQHLGLKPEEITQNRMSYDLRRLRLHGLLERIPKTHRYRPTTLGLRVALFYSRTYQRILRQGLSILCDPAGADSSKLRQSYEYFEATLDALIEKLAA